MNAQPGNFELELQTFTDSVVDVCERLFDPSLRQRSLEQRRDVDFPESRTRRVGVVGNERRASLAEREFWDEQNQRGKTTSDRRRHNARGAGPSCPHMVAQLSHDTRRATGAPPECRFGAVLRPDPSAELAAGRDVCLKVVIRASSAMRWQAVSDQREGRSPGILGKTLRPVAISSFMRFSSAARASS
jgi:hypothetical protein